MTIKVMSGQTIFDIATIAYQDASRTYDLLNDNPQINNINSDLRGMTLTYTPSVIVQKEVLMTVTPSKKDVTIGFMQGVFDVALQYYGGAENVYKFIQENLISGIHEDPTGINLNYAINNTYVPIYYRNTGKDIATKPIKSTPIIAGSFILRTDGSYLLRTDGGRFPR